MAAVWFCNHVSGGMPKHLVLFGAIDPSKKIPQCSRQIPHNAPFCNKIVDMCAHFGRQFSLVEANMIITICVSHHCLYHCATDFASPKNVIKYFCVIGVLFSVRNHMSQDAAPPFCFKIKTAPKTGLDLQTMILQGSVPNARIDNSLAN